MRSAAGPRPVGGLKCKVRCRAGGDPACDELLDLVVVVLAQRDEILVALDAGANVGEVVQVEVADSADEAAGIWERRAPHAAGEPPIR